MQNTDFDVHKIIEPVLEQIAGVQQADCHGKFAMLKDIAASNPNVAIALTDLSGTLLFANSAYFSKLLGYDHELDIVGRSLYQFGYSYEHSAELIALASENGTWVGNRVVSRKCGAKACHSLNAFLLNDSSGAFICLVASSADSGDCKQEVEKLFKARLFRYKILDSIADPLVVKDQQYRYTLVNDAFCRFLNRDRMELLGRTDYEIFSKAEADIFREVDDAIFLEGKEQIIEETITDTNGVDHIFVAKKTLYSDENNNKFIVCILRDVTEQREAEKALSSKQKRIAAMAIELSLAEARERIRIASELHDQIGQTLILARIKLAMLDKMPRTEEYDNTLAIASDLVDQVIQNVRSLTVQISPPLLLGAGLETAVESLSRQMLTDYGLKVAFFDDRSEKPLTEEIRSIVYQATRELLINVVKHAETDSANVCIGSDGEMMSLKVEDNGKGFITDGNALSESSSCSFGLFSIQQRIQAMGGSFCISSEPGRGTTAILKVPLSLEPFQAKAARPNLKRRR